MLNYIAPKIFLYFKNCVMIKYQEEKGHGMLIMYGRLNVTIQIIF